MGCGGLVFYCGSSESGSKDMSRVEITIAAIASLLKSMKGQKKSPVLFLGARAGGLFHNEYLYKMLRDFSLRRFDDLSNTDKFAECYKIISDKRFSVADRYQILAGALSPLWHREEDKALAALIKEGLFETIITTRIDTLLEDAYAPWDMKEPDDYQVITYESLASADTSFAQKRVIKIFGDINTPEYTTVGGELDLDAKPAFKQLLVSNLSKDILMVGYDPTWDQIVEEHFPAAEGKVWYVNEEEPPQNIHLSLTLKQRNCQFLTGMQGSYASFFKALYYFLDDDIINQQEVPAVPLLPHGQEGKRILISCSHKDQQYLERLHIHLKGYMYMSGEEDMLDIWDDKRVPVEADWEKEIKVALEKTKVMIVLISKDFLASDFNRQRVLPFLIEEAGKGYLTLIPVFLDPPFNVLDPTSSVPNEVYKYASIRNSVSEPLKLVDEYEQEVVWAKVAERAYNVLICKV